MVDLEYFNKEIVYDYDKKEDEEEKLEEKEDE